MAKGYALLIGLQHVNPDTYHGWDGGTACLGCKADVDNMANILGDKGYQITQIFTEDATHDTILGNVKLLAQKAESGDICIFYYSGHGGQTSDDEGQNDDTLVAYDREVEGHELLKIWPLFKENVRIVMISDSCHSGSNYRDMPLMHPKVIETNVNGDMKAMLIHLAGCKSNQFSNGFLNGGEFTLALLHAYQTNPKVNYIDFIANIRQIMDDPEQHAVYNEYGAVNTDQFKFFRNQVVFTV